MTTPVSNDYDIKIDEQVTKFLELNHTEFKNKVSNAKITMEVPAVGALEDPDQRLDRNRARLLADEVAHFLRRVLG